MALGSCNGLDRSQVIVARRRPVVAAGVRGLYSTSRVALGYPGVSGVRSRYACGSRGVRRLRLSCGGLPRGGRHYRGPRRDARRSLLYAARLPCLMRAWGESLVTRGLFFVGDGPATINPTCATWLTNDPFGGGSLPDSRSYFDRQTTSGDLTWEFPIGPGRLRLDRHGDTTKAWPSP